MTGPYNKDITAKCGPPIVERWVEVQCTARVCLNVIEDEDPDYIKTLTKQFLDKSLGNRKEILNIEYGEYRIMEDE